MDSLHYLGDAAKTGTRGDKNCGCSSEDHDSAKDSSSNQCCKTPKTEQTPKSSFFPLRQQETARKASSDASNAETTSVREIASQSKKKIQAYFSKFPCIKTCMAKIDVSNKGPRRSDSRRIDFEKVEDDFQT